MVKETVMWHSDRLDKDMHVNVYGCKGVPLLFFPTQDSMAGSLYDFGMIGCIKDYIEKGKICVFTVDTVDKESWSCTEGINSWRTARQESYFQYIVNEVVPFIRTRCGKVLPLTAGLSMGADHAAITFLRRPDLFQGLLALSGVYDCSYFYGNYMDGDLYNNSPEHFLANMNTNHPYINLYNSKKEIFCIGQGAWEEPGATSQHNLQCIFDEKGIHAWFDYWGNDVSHDWFWWFKQIRYFLPFLLGEKNIPEEHS